MDPSLGVPPRAGYRCKKCGGNDITCPGHFGHITLVKPVFHCGMLPLLQKLLGCVCHNCGNLMADESDIKFRSAIRLHHPQAKLAAIANICKGKKECKHLPTDKNEDTTDRGCGTKHPSVLRSGLNFKVKYPPPKANEPIDENMSGERLLYAEEALEILKKISDEDCEKLGLDPRFCRPVALSASPSLPPSLSPLLSIERAATCAP